MIDQKLIDSLLQAATVSRTLSTEFPLRNSDVEPYNRRLMAFMPGAVMPIHRSIVADETCLIIHGRVSVVFYTDMGAEVKRFMLGKESGNFGLNVPSGQWYTIEIAEPAVVLQAKLTPYSQLDPSDIMF